MERISVIKGKLPILLVAPYGTENLNTGYFVEKIAAEMGTFGIINRGWIKSDNVDCLNDKADCGNIKHIQEDVVKEEFLEPILRSIAQIQKDIDDIVYILYIYGCENKIKTITNQKNLDVIVGYGKSDSTKVPGIYTCSLKIKDAFCYFLENENLNVYEAIKNKKYTGQFVLNLNQLSTLWFPNTNTQSLKISLTKELRNDMLSLNLTCQKFMNALDDLLMFDDSCTIRYKNKYI